jgi:hypothetical protein
MAGRNQFTERRSTPRTEVLGRVALKVLSTPVSARLREISTGGCAVETPTPLPQGVHHFRLEIAGREAIELTAELVHSTRLSLPDGEAIYLAGFEFLPLNESTARSLTGLVEHIGALCLA